MEHLGIGGGGVGFIGIFEGGAGIMGKRECFISPWTSNNFLITSLILFLFMFPSYLIYAVFIYYILFLILSVFIMEVMKIIT